MPIIFTNSAEEMLATAMMRADYDIINTQPAEKEKKNPKSCANFNGLNHSSSDNCWHLTLHFNERTKRAKLHRLYRKYQMYIPAPATFFAAPASFFFPAGPDR